MDLSTPHLPGFSWTLTLEYAIKLLTAFLLALPIGWERERATRMVGLRTISLVAAASCAYIIIGAEVVGINTDGHSRLIGGFMAGIGFIGGGAIIKHGGDVRGTATAASIWTAGVIGVASGYGKYEMAVLVSLLTLLALVTLTAVERRMQRQRPDRSG